MNHNEKIIEYFKFGIKETKNFRIGIEHEKFLFNNKENSFMNKIKCIALIFIFSITTFYGQNTKGETSIGFHYGFGNEIKNKNYSY